MGIHRSKHAKPKNTSKLRLLILAICFFTMIYSGIKIIKWYRENKQNEAIMETVLNSVTIKENELIINFDELKKENKDTVAWLKVSGTYIDYPVVKATNNSYYLDHSFDNSYNSAGWIFADYNNKFDGTDKHIVIYGHNRKDGSMFGTLKSILDEEWYVNDNNRKIILITEEGTKEYEVFSVYKIENEDYYLKNKFTSDEEFLKFIQELKGRSIYNFGQELNKEDKILTLSTCAETSRYRVVLHAKLITK